MHDSSRDKFKDYPGDLDDTSDDCASNLALQYGGQLRARVVREVVAHIDAPEEARVGGDKGGHLWPVASEDNDGVTVVHH